MTAQDIAKYMTIEQVAEATGASVRHIMEEKRRGNIRAFKLGKRLQFDPAEVQKWINRKIVK